LLEANLKCEEIGGYLAEPRTARYKTNTTGHPLGFVRFIIYVLNNLPTTISCRQAEFLHQIAAVYESTAGISHWWIGLTDMGMYQLTNQKCGNTIHKIKKGSSLKYIIYNR